MSIRFFGSGARWARVLVLLLALALPALWLLHTPTTEAQAANRVPLIAINRTNLTICDLYISPTSAAGWTNEVLGNSTMAPWARRTFYVAPGMYNLRAVFCDGRSISESNVNVVGAGVEWTITGTGGAAPTPNQPPAPTPTPTPRSGSCVIPPSGPWPPCARGGGGAGATPTPTPTPRPQQQITLTVTNKTNVTVCKLYLSPASSPVWNNEVLKGSQMRLWDRRTFSIAPDVYDIRADDCNGVMHFEEYGINIRTNYAIDLTP